MTTHDIPDSRTEEADLRADIYALLAALLREPPSEALRQWLAGLEGEPDDIRLSQAWSRLATAAADSDVERLERAHFRHLIGVIQGDVLPYASYYREGGLMEASLVTLRKDLKTLGIQRSADVSEPEDHLAAMCEVMAMLISQNDQRAGSFFHRHLAPWAGRCMHDLARVDTPFYAALGELATLFFQRESAILIDNTTLGTPVPGTSVHEDRGQALGAGE